MYQRMLVAVDGSETSEVALDHALQLAREQRAQVRVVHVVETLKYLTVSSAGGYPFDPAPLIEALRDEAREILARAAAKARDAGVVAEVEMLEDLQAPGRVAAIVVQEAARCNADLVVLGTHGRRGFDRLLLGSVAEALIRIAQTPVLLVRAKPTH
jgi:nucleotide-binding universal stress UspA family protein